MRIITRNEQDALANRSYSLQLTDRYFDGMPLPRTIRPQTWLSERSVHEGRILSARIDSTRYFVGPQNCVVRDDNRRVTWAAFVETPLLGERGQSRLMLYKFPGSWPSSMPPLSPESTCLVEDNVRRYNLALNKFTGKVTTTWVTRSGGEQTLWLDGEVVDTRAKQPDFPFYAFSQPPIGHVATEEPPFSLFGYKCRETGQLFVRRLESGKLGHEVDLQVSEILGGITFGISGESVLARVDLLRDGKIVPALIMSSDCGNTFSNLEPIDLSDYERISENDPVVPGYTEPVVDVGGHFHVPIHMSDGRQSVALNYVVRENALVEAIRVDGTSQIINPQLGNQALSQVAQEVFPATLGNPNAFGTGTTDGHGLIMVISTEGRLFSSNSSAGGLYYPESALLNHEMPLIAAYASTECYTSGLKPNFVSMDYFYIEADEVGRPISSDLHMETWDMPLPIPQISATGVGSQVEITVETDMDLEPGQTSFSFSDPSIRITDLRVTSLRTAMLDTDASDLNGQTIRIDVDSLFHRHYAEAVISSRD